MGRSRPCRLLAGILLPALTGLAATSSSACPPGPACPPQPPARIEHNQPPHPEPRVPPPPSSWRPPPNTIPRPAFLNPADRAAGPPPHEHDADENRRRDRDEQRRAEADRARHRYRVGAHFPLGPGVAGAIIPDFTLYGLAPPPPGATWIQYGPDMLLVDNTTGTILQVISPPLAANPLAGPVLYNIGIAWDAEGGWATRIAPTLRDAITQAIAACSTLGTPCSDSGLSLGDGGFACYALVRSGTRIYGADEASLDAAAAVAEQQCAEAGNDACVVQAANCNDHP